MFDGKCEVCGGDLFEGQTWKLANGDHKLGDKDIFVCGSICAAYSIYPTIEDYKKSKETARVIES